MNIALKILLLKVLVPLFICAFGIIYEQRTAVCRMAKDDIGFIKALAGTILAIFIIIGESLQDWWKSKNIGSLFSFHGKH